MVNFARRVPCFCRVFVLNIIFGTLRSTLRDHCARGDWGERHPFLSGHDKQRAIKTKPIPLTNKCYFSWFASFSRVRCLARSILSNNSKRANRLVRTTVSSCWSPCGKFNKWTGVWKISWKMKVNMASYVEDLVKCGFLEMKLPRKQRKLTHKASLFKALILSYRL